VHVLLHLLTGDRTRRQRTDPLSYTDWEYSNTYGREDTDFQYVGPMEDIHPRAVPLARYWWRLEADSNSHAIADSNSHAIEDEADLGHPRPHVNPQPPVDNHTQQRSNKAMAFKPGDKAMIGNVLVDVHSECVGGQYLCTDHGKFASYLVRQEELSPAPQEPNITIKVYAPGAERAHPDILDRAVRRALHAYIVGEADIEITYANGEVRRKQVS
jgi:hypothetical protein